MIRVQLADDFPGAHQRRDRAFAPFRLVLAFPDEQAGMVGGCPVGQGGCPGGQGGAVVMPD